MNTMYINSIILALGVVGSCVSFYIYKKESKHHPLTCPIGGCNEVVFSKYGKTFGIPNALLGMLYYDCIFTVYLVLLLWPSVYDIMYPVLFFFLVKIAALGAFLFSLYLTAVQAFIIKKWCFWCVISAVVSTAMFFLIAVF